MSVAMLAAVARQQLHMKMCRGSDRSAMPETALSNVPVTKPMATILEAKLTHISGTANSRAIWGITAVAENQVLSAMVVAATSKMIARHFPLGSDRDKINVFRAAGSLLNRPRDSRGETELLPPTG